MLILLMKNIIKLLKQKCFKPKIRNKNQYNELVTETISFIKNHFPETEERDLLEKKLKESAGYLFSDKTLGKPNEVIKMVFLKDYDNKENVTQIQIENRNINSVSWITLNENQTKDLYHRLGLSINTVIEK